jgi:tetratricopeptide (TPR) repeat protein
MAPRDSIDDLLDEMRAYLDHHQPERTVQVGDTVLNKALQTLQQAQLLYEQIDDGQGAAIAIANRATIHAAAGEPFRALELYADALKTFTELTDLQNMRRTLANISIVTAAIDAFFQTFEQLLPNLELTKR